MIFHELCHSLVEGEDSFAAPDWGMDNTGPDARLARARLPARAVGAHRTPRPARRVRADHRLPGLVLGPAVGGRARRSHRSIRSARDRGPPARRAATVGPRARGRARRHRPDRGRGRALREARAATLAHRARAAVARRHATARAPSHRPPGGDGRRHVRHLRVAARGARDRSLPPGRRQARRSLARVRALRGSARLPDLRRVLPRGLSLGRGRAARSGASRPSPRSSSIAAATSRSGAPATGAARSRAASSSTAPPPATTA